MNTIVRCLFAAVVLAAITYVFWQHEQASRYAKPGVVTVIPVINDRLFMFGYEEVRNGAAVFNGSIEMEHHSSRRVEANGLFAFAHVSTVGEHYSNVAFLPFSSGGYWLHDGEGSIIVSEFLAWRLFGSINVVGLQVRIGDNYHDITGVTRDAAEPPRHVDGFAWIPRSLLETQNYYAAILHFIPDTYNLVHTNMDVLRILEVMSRRASDYVIIDINSYVTSIALRGKLLLSLAGLVFAFYMLRFVYMAWKKNESNGRWVWVICAALASTVYFALLVPHISMDFWLPAFYPEGLSGYGRMFFNIGLDVPRQYLPNYLAALFDQNARANWGFAIGIAALFGVVYISTPTRLSLGKNSILARASS